MVLLARLSLALFALSVSSSLARSAELSEERYHIEQKDRTDSRGRRPGEQWRGLWSGPSPTTRAMTSSKKNQNRARFGTRPRSTRRLQRIAFR